MTTKPKVQYLSGAVSTYSGDRHKRGITSDKSSHTFAILEINDEKLGPVFLHDVVIIGSAADVPFYFDRDQHIELVVSVNKPRMEISGNGMKAIEMNRSLVYALRSDGGAWHGEDAAILLAKKHEGIGKGYNWALLVAAPFLAIMAATVALAGPAIFFTLAILKTRKHERRFKALYPSVDEVRALLESKTTIRV